MKHYLNKNLFAILFFTFALIASFPARVSGREKKRVNYPESQRAYWLSVMDKIAYPLLSNGSRGTLKQNMPVEKLDGVTGERKCTYLEAVGRLLCGMAPWLELSDSCSAKELALRDQYRAMAVKTITSIVDPASPDYLYGYMESQMLVDTSFLAQALLRAHHQLWFALDETTKNRLAECFRKTRVVNPYYSNWLLFSAMVETFFLENDLPFDQMRIQLPVKKHQEWYLGDGTYGDGPDFHSDYYNSFVIQPSLLDISSVLVNHQLMDAKEGIVIQKRFTRYAAIQERMISPEGTYPIVGRSIAYRMGAFQGLSQASLLHLLPAEVKPAQVRCALTSVIRRLMDAPGTFNKEGWLQIGVCGHQNAMAEYYISTGSLYLCTTGLLALGLPATDPFWSDPAEPWTSVKVWNGENVKADKAL